MSNYDLKTELKNLTALDPVTIGSNTTTDGIEIDTLGYESLTFFIRVSSRTDGTFTPAITDTDTSGSGEVAVADQFLIGTEAEAALSADGVSKIGYVGKKRFVQLDIDSTLVTTGATVDVIAVLGNPQRSPVA
jgi:hypothetical protein